MYSILIVDDERWVRTSLRRVIELTGLPFRVVHESNHGLEAMDWLKDNKADLVLADVRMPVMDGITLLEEINRQSGPPVILISGYDDFQYAQKALRYGGKDYLLKPVEVDDLKESLHRWMADNQPHAPGPVEEAEIKPEELSTIDQVLHIIRDSMPGDVTLTDVAARVHLNASYLSQLFKRRMNKKFVDYVVETRIEEAKKLLTKTSLRITEIADRLGYADVAYFSSTFKKITGQSPLEYRVSLKSPHKVE